MFEKHIPIPMRKVRKTGRAAILKKMEIGDSFTAPAEERNSFAPTAKQIGIKITTEKISETSIRIWRIE